MLWLKPLEVAVPVSVLAPEGVPVVPLGVPLGNGGGAVPPLPQEDKSATQTSSCDGLCF